MENEKKLASLMKTTAFYGTKKSTFEGRKMIKNEMWSGNGSARKEKKGRKWIKNPRVRKKKGEKDGIVRRRKEENFIGRSNGSRGKRMADRLFEL